ncbi:hypothetical protein, partial [Edaphobacter sp. HDX4]|uniref:hypothetical protein n=1 Tax=Edaphobacter sp. HDX4 TaxID=2794064 RepID=UPI002FE5D171
DHRSSEAAYARVQDLTRAYNQLESGKWEGMMDSAPRARQVFYQGNWQVLERLGVSGSSVALGAPGLASSVMDSGHLEKAPWIEY